MLEYLNELTKTNDITYATIESFETELQNQYFSRY